MDQQDFEKMVAEFGDRLLEINGGEDENRMLNLEKRNLRCEQVQDQDME